jgi:gliding motility-associated-like protein
LVDFLGRKNGFAPLSQDRKDDSQLPTYLLIKTKNIKKRNMRLLLTAFSVLFFAALLSAQPVNDDCAGVIDLGVLPACTGTVYDNVGATASDIGFGNIPSCFNGGGVQRDVWFAFTTNDTLIDITITVQGVETGPNNPLLNPQISIYRGACSFNNLADLGFCVSAPAGTNQTQLDVLGLTPNTTYFLRINDYSATASPNWGDFTLCIEEYVPAFNMGDQPGTTSCTGTIYDSGGPDGNYSNNENHVFTISPAQFSQCIELTVHNFSSESGFDRLNVFAGNTTGAPLIISLTGTTTDVFTIQAGSPTITLQFISDGSVNGAGFEISWQCSPLACAGSSIANPTPISGLPFNQGGFSTCSAAATFNTSPCLPNPAFLNGPEYVFAYQSPGGFCASVQVLNAESGTGVAVFDGPPNAAGTACLGSSANGSLNGLDFTSAGTYYIVVAQNNGCTNFGLSIQEEPCNLDPSLVNALCNPLNGCIDPAGLPSVFSFNQGFQDIEFNVGVNNGCWLNPGAAQPNYYWFTIEAQAAGPFGFIVQAANPAEASDIDFSVWGPFNREEVCETPQAVVNFINTNQPIRSSWAAGADPTGLASIHPVTGVPVTDPYDCNPIPGANGDDFASVINCQPGEIYAVLINDWGNSIQSGAISVDWAPSAPEVLAPPALAVLSSDTAICSGEAVQLLISSSVDNITWLKDTTTLSCLDCLDPIATPTETTLYAAVVDGVCFQDTVEVLVQVYNVNAGPDVTVCRNEEIQIVAGSNFLDAAYAWTVPAGVSLSCTDCPDPFITAEQPGVYTITVELVGPTCVITDQMQLTVLPQDAAQYNINEDQQICAGGAVSVGGAAVPGVTYSWSSNPLGFFSDDANPTVSPTETTTYYISASDGNCPVPSIDSVLVIVDQLPVLNVATDTVVCQDEPILLGNTALEPGVTYTWNGPSQIEDLNDPNSVAFPQNSGTYTLTAVRGACTTTESFQVEVVEIALSLVDANQAPLPDTVLLCKGDQLDLLASFSPAAAVPLWSSTDPSFVGTIAPGISVAPATATTYYARAAVPGCFKVDSIFVLVDSLPADLSILPADTTVCEGELVLLTSPIYEPIDFPNIEFLWSPPLGQQTGDSLYNMVISGLDTVTYQRISINGACVDTSFATVNVIRIDAVQVMPADTVICAGESVQLIATADFEPTEISWQLSPEGPISCTDCYEPVVTPAVTTTYTFEAKIEDCPVAASATVQVRQPPALGTVPLLRICLGESTSLNSLFDEFTTYTWTSTDPSFGTVFDPQPIVSPTQNHTYTVVADNGVCEPRQAEVLVEVVQPPVLSIDVPQGPFCPGESLQLSALVIEGGGEGERFLWQTPGGLLESAVIDIAPRVTGLYTFTYISPSRCDTIEENYLIEVFPDLNLFLTGSPSNAEEVSQGTVVTFDAFTNPQVGSPVTYRWFLNGELVAEGPELSMQDLTLLQQASVVVVEAISPEGCVQTDSLFYDVERPLLAMPNAFTPNGDGVNDFFQYLSTGVIDEVVEFRVFNRWGQVVYNNENPGEGWDGNYKGKPQPSEVYMYMVKIRFLDGELSELLKGDVTLLR